MANEELLKILKQGVDAWNAWAGENTGEPPDLREANLEGANLAQANLLETNLRNANLEGPCSAHHFSSKVLSLWPGTYRRLRVGLLHKALWQGLPPSARRKRVRIRVILLTDIWLS
ncbi:MAG: pentapeptide repeat-containing protein [Geminicoccaceae bacterium]